MVVLIAGTMISDRQMRKNWKFLTPALNYPTQTGQLLKGLWAGVVGEAKAIFSGQLGLKTILKTA